MLVTMRLSTFGPSMTTGSRQEECEMGIVLRPSVAPLSKLGGETYRAVGGVGSNDGGVGVNGAVLVAVAVCAVVDHGGSAGGESDERELHVVECLLFSVLFLCC